MEMESNMTSSEKLNLLLDGETEGLETSELFYELSHNQELQNEFVDIVKLKKMMNQSTEAPPEKLKRGIVAGIGLTGGGFGYYLQNAGVLAGIYSLLTHKVAIGAFALLIGSIATFSLMNTETEQNVTSNNELVPKFELSELSIPVVNSREVNSEIESNQYFDNIESNQARVDKSNQIAANNLNISPNSISTLNTTNDNERVINKNSVVINSVDIASSDIYRVNLESNNNNISIPQSVRTDEVNELSRSYYTSNNKSFSLQTRGLSGTSMQSYDLSPTDAPAFNNVGIALMYNITDDFSFGLEFGQEFLVQDVQGESFNNREPVSENLLTFWGAMKANYTFSEIQIVDGLSPYSSLLLGGTNNGWIGKASVGLVYDISDKFAFFAAPEWTTLFYKNYSELNTSDKYGITYGVSVKF